MKSYILTVTPNPAIDKAADVDHFVPGKNHRVTNVHCSAGGKGINVSRALKRLRVSTIASGFLGGPEGEFIEAALKKERIHHRFVPIEGETRTSLAVIDKRNGKITRILEEGPAVKQKDLAAFRKEFNALLQNCAFVVLSGRNIPGAGDRFYYELIRAAGRRHKRVVLDTSGAPLLKSLVAKPFLVKPNLSEAREILKKTLSGRAALKRGLNHFLQAGAGNVIISAGDKGAAASDGENYWLAVPPKVKVVNTVGCGDALIAGVLSVLVKGGRFAEAVRFGVAAGTANAMSIRPGHFTQRQVLDLAGRVDVSRL